MKKRLVAIILAATMIAGTGLTASAADAEIKDMAGAGAGQEVTGDAEVNLPEIKVTVPTTADIVINPYQMEYKFNESDSDSYTGQIICVPQDIVNESNVAIDVNVAELTTTNVTEGITISTTAITDKVTAKSAFLYLEVVEKGADGAKFADSYNSKSTSQVVIPDASGEGSKVKKGAKNAIVTLAAGNTTATTASFKIGGSVVANPTVTDENKVVSADPWLSTDTLKISFKFTFTPKVNEVKSGS